MGLGEANSICHETEKRFGVHMPDDLRHFIESKVMSAEQRATKEIEASRDEWRQSDLDNRFPPVTYIHKRKIRIRYIRKQCAFVK